MALQPNQFLGNVGPVGDQGHLPHHVSCGERRPRPLQELGHPVGQPCAVFRQYRWHTLSNRRDRLPDFAAAVPHVAGQRVAFGPPHALESVEGGVEGTGHQRPALFDGIARRGRFHQDTGQRQDPVDRPRCRDAVRSAEILEIIEIS